MEELREHQEEQQELDEMMNDFMQPDEEELAENDEIFDELVGEIENEDAE